MDVLHQKMKEVFENVNNLLKNAEEKNSKLLTASGLIFTAALTLLNSNWISIPSYWKHGLYSAIACSVLAIILLILSYLPKTKITEVITGKYGTPTESDNLIYFCDLAKYDPQQPQLLADKMNSMYFINTDSENTLEIKVGKIHIDLSNQIIINSRITCNKYSLSRKATCLILISLFGVPIIPLVILPIIRFIREFIMSL